MSQSIGKWRSLFGQYERIMQKLRLEDRASLMNFVRVDPEMFDGDGVFRVTVRGGLVP